MRDNLDESAAQQLLASALPSLTQDQLNTFYQVYVARKDELTQAVKNNAVTIGATLQLVDFDWSARVRQLESSKNNMQIPCSHNKAVTHTISNIIQHYTTL